MADTTALAKPPEATNAETPPPPPEKRLTPVERAVAAFDRVRTATATKAAAAIEAQKEPAAAVVETPKEEAKKEGAGAVETPTPTAGKPKEEEPLSTKFALVAKLERQARESIKAAKLKESSLEAREKELTAKLEAIENKKRSAKTNVKSWLDEGGLTNEDVTQFYLNGGKPTTDAQTSELKTELELFKKQQAEERAAAARAEQERTKADQQQTYTAWKTAVVDFVKQHASEYELINQQGAHELVPAVIQQRFDSSKESGSPVVLSEKEAADLVEKHLEEQAEKLLQTKKLASRLKPVEPAPPADAAQPRVTTTPTLNNGMTASASSGGKPRTPAERKQAALMAMEKIQANK